MAEHDEAADKLEQEADRMEKASGDLKQEIDEQRADWDSKAKSEGVPGAQPVPEQGAEPPPDREPDESAGEDGNEETENRP
jgi:hypothetical protein